MNLEKSVGRDENGNILIIDSANNFAASKLGERWQRGIHFSTEEVLNGTFQDVDPDEATALLTEAQTALPPRRMGPRTEAASAEIATG